ncbi:MAG: SDR family oxidoreductase [Actinobacteria bacterium]|nr:SDR family oxidoreductase [Cyanobacteriota bacterium]MCL4384955.1 SDR family oxidoreductase [Cyanobacteriota bacterium]MCL6086937.1 SDR family oxidoreductase [Actinomycetota bacterium]MCL6086942.1 SDR family oxidoreductase [Actinomycetota bacterium]
MDLNNKTVIVTGASKGIGRAISIELAKEGAIVVLAARTKEKLIEVKKNIDSFNGKSLIVPADMSREEDILKLFSKVKEEFGKLDILINNAGIFIGGNLVDFDISDYEKIMNVNFKAVFLCCQQALKIMIPQKNGFIINISSNVVFKGYPQQAIYSASKNAVVGLSKSMANEVQKDGISVALIHPGGVDTELIDSARPDINKSDLMPPEDIAKTIIYMLKLSDNSWVDEIIIRRRTAKPF